MSRCTLYNTVVGSCRFDNNNHLKWRLNDRRNGRCQRYETKTGKSFNSNGLIGEMANNLTNRINQKRMIRRRVAKRRRDAERRMYVIPANDKSDDNGVCKIGRVSCFLSFRFPFISFFRSELRPRKRLLPLLEWFIYAPNLCECLCLCVRVYVCLLLLLEFILFLFGGVDRDWICFVWVSVCSVAVCQSNIHFHSERTNSGERLRDTAREKKEHKHFCRLFNLNSHLHNLIYFRFLFLPITEQCERRRAHW